MSLFDLNGIVNSISTQTFTVQRPLTDTYSSTGKANTRVFTNFITKGSIQPLTGSDLTRDTEGYDKDHVISIWSVAPLSLRDRVVINGLGSFEVEKLEDWAASGNYWKVIARRLGPGEGA